ncbi:MAG TPA: dihydrofolate reductase family protein [Jatrophihabitans sp.]|jgi:dihydrofolate reductase|uniref:dihydrofolate reductase family protein n=1 Tax=Jatrophihabitans sp. TaxID=1932789 RepID=UPI002DFDA8AE|nr:dihydrofolate reductase family protein [Jatrophihabitans sp.]
MRKIVVMMSTSVDGFMSDPDGGLDWSVVDAELHQHFNDWLATAGAFLDGRVSYELMAGYWPTADADPQSSPQEAEFAGIWRDMPKIVYSTTLEHAEWNTTIRREVDVDEVRALQRERGGDLVVGGANLAATFRALDLVDEYRLYIHPVLLGRGVPLFHDLDERAELGLVETRIFGTGVVLLRYARAGRPA